MPKVRGELSPIHFSAIRLRLADMLWAIRSMTRFCHSPKVHIQAFRLPRLEDAQAFTTHFGRGGAAAFIML